MNFETLLLNHDDYNYQEYHTVSERVFWHWLYKKLGKLTFDKSFTSNVYSIESQNNKIVQCFGSIDAGNSLSTEFGMFNETYINIPTSYGAGPVFFKSSYDNNYRSKQYRSANGGTTLEGRDYDTQYNSYLGDETPMYDGNNGYNTVSSAANGPDGLEIVKDIDTLQRIARRHFSQLDGAAKDTDANINISSYDDINVDINNIFNIDTEFEFNANIQATPKTQDIISGNISMLDDGVTGIENVKVDSEGNPLFAISFDNETSWYMMTDLGWAVISEEHNGMTSDVFQNITTQQWSEYLENVDFIKIRISLFNSDDSVIQVKINYTN